MLVGPRIDPQRFHNPWVGKAAAQGIKSGCAAPLLAHGRTLGAISVVSHREAAFHKDHALLLEQCAGQIAIAVQNALNFERERAAERQVSREHDRTKLLQEVNNAVVSHLDLNELLKCITARISGVMASDSAFIALCTPEGTHLQTQALDIGKLENVAFAEGLRIPIEGTPEERAIRRVSPCW